MNEMKQVEEFLDIDEEEENFDEEENEVDLSGLSLKNDFEEIRADIRSTIAILSTSLQELERMLTNNITDTTELPVEGELPKKPLSADRIAGIISTISDVKLKYLKEWLSMYKTRADIHKKEHPETDKEKEIKTQDIIKNFKKRELF